jgi:hypothetical protein
LELGQHCGLVSKHDVQHCLDQESTLCRNYQVNDDEMDQPVSLILVCSAPPPRPEVLAQIVLPADLPQAGVDLSIDLQRDLAFPSNSFLGQGAFGQVGAAFFGLPVHRVLGIAASPVPRSVQHTLTQ